MTDPDEPARRLYDALRTAQMISEGYGEWDALRGFSPSLQANLRHAARLLWPEPEQGVVPAEQAVTEEPAVTEHRHMWDCAACRHDVLILYCRHCPAIRKETL